MFEKLIEERFKVVHKSHFRSAKLGIDAKYLWSGTFLELDFSFDFDTILLTLKRIIANFEDGNSQIVIVISGNQLPFATSSPLNLHFRQKQKCL